VGFYMVLLVVSLMVTAWAALVSDDDRPAPLLRPVLELLCYFFNSFWLLYAAFSSLLWLGPAVLVLGGIWLAHRATFAMFRRKHRISR